LTSSANPSQAGQAVTFTATVTSGSGTPTGTVTFNDGGSVIGTGTLSGGAATFTTSTLTQGTHTITAGYAGGPGFAPSTSAARTQTVNAPADSAKLRAMQIVGSQSEAQSSGQAVSGAIDAAVGDGFNGNGQPVVANDNGIRINFAAEPQQQSAVRERVGD